MTQFDPYSIKSVTESHAEAALQAIRVQTDRMRGIAREFCSGDWLQFINEQLDDLDESAAYTLKTTLETVIKAQQYQ